MSALGQKRTVLGEMAKSLLLAISRHWRIIDTSIDSVHSTSRAIARIFVQLDKSCAVLGQGRPVISDPSSRVNHAIKRIVNFP